MNGRDVNDECSTCVFDYDLASDRCCACMHDPIVVRRLRRKSDDGDEEAPQQPHKYPRGRRTLMHTIDDAWLEYRSLDDDEVSEE